MIWRFGEFEVDVPLFQLRRGDTPLKLERLVFDLLLYLIEERRRVVLRHELIVRLWPRETVVPTALARVVSTLRSALSRVEFALGVSVVMRAPPRSGAQCT